MSQGQNESKVTILGTKMISIWVGAQPPPPHPIPISALHSLPPTEILNMPLSLLFRCS